MRSYIRSDRTLLGLIFDMAFSTRHTTVVSVIIAAPSAILRSRSSSEWIVESSGARN